MKICAKESKDPWEILSEAMATIATGEAWLLKNEAGVPDGKCWKIELEAMKRLKKVTAIWRVDIEGKKHENLLA